MTEVSILLAVFAFAMQFIFTKGYQKAVKVTMMSVLWFTAGAGGLCGLIFLIVNGFNVELQIRSLLYAVVYALLGIAYNVMNVIGMKYEKTYVITLFVMIGGLILPALFGFLVLRESIIWNQIVGIALMLMGFVYQFYKSKDKGKKENEQIKLKSDKFKSIAICLFLFVCNGVISIVTKLHQQNKEALSEAQFVMWYFILMCVFSMLALLVLAIGKKEKIYLEIMHQPKRHHGGYIFVLIMILGYAISNGIGNICNFYLAGKLNASFQFPLISAGVVAVSALLSRLVFQEKFEKASLINIGLNMLGILIFVL